MRVRRRRTWFVCGWLTLAGGAVVSAVARGDSPSPPGTRDAAASAVASPVTRPTTSPATGPSTTAAPIWSPTSASSDDPRLARAILQLGSGSYRAREEAAQVLWSMGNRAIPALKWAADSGDPELAMRARALLESFAYGVRPDTPRAVIDLLQQYRAAVPQQRQTIIRALAEHGLPGARVLLKLSQDERDVIARQAVVQSLAAIARPSAAKLLGDGESDTARAMLAAVAGQHDSNARDFAALLLVRGGLDDEIGRLQATLPAAKPANPPGPGAPPQPPGAARVPPVFARQAPPSPWERLAFLLRAKGDLAGALRAAGQAPEAPLSESLLAEAGDWKALAARADAHGVDLASVDELGYAVAYHRLAGDAAGTEKWLAKLVRYGEENPNDHVHVAEALLLNDHPAEAIDLLRKHKEPALAAEYLEPRLQFEDVLAVTAQAKADGSPGLPQVRAKSAVALHFMGRAKDAGAALESILAGDDGVVDFQALLSVIEAGRETGQPPDRLDAWCLATIKSGRPNQSQELPVHVFEHAGFDRPEQAGDWWDVMRDLYPGEAAGDTFARLKALDRKELPPDEVKRLTDRAQASAARLSDPARDARLMLVADTLEDLGRTAEATGVVERLAEISPTAPTLERLGDLYAKAEQWPRAASAYDRAWQRDRGRPLPLLLRGWMLVKSGQERQGRELIETAHALSLSDETERHSLMTALARRSLNDEAKRERDLILRTAEPGSWERGDALRRAAEEAHNKGDDLVAADLWDRAFLNNLSTHVSFVEPQANLMIPVLIHRARAQSYARTGRLAESLAEAKTCFDLCPGDADAQIAIVNTLAKSNHPKEADEVYARARSTYAKLAEKYPQSPPAHNLIAWLESRCRRDLGDAVNHAQKAADLEPDNTAVLDTLAEAHLQRGDVAKARELVKRCLKLEPTSEHHRKNLARIEAAVPGKPVPDLDGGE